MIGQVQTVKSLEMCPIRATAASDVQIRPHRRPKCVRCLGVQPVPRARNACECRRWKQRLDPGPVIAADIITRPAAQKQTITFKAPRNLRKPNYLSISLAKVSKCNRQFFACKSSDCNKNDRNIGSSIWPSCASACARLSTPLTSTSLIAWIR